MTGSFHPELDEQFEQLEQFEMDDYYDTDVLAGSIWDGWRSDEESNLRPAEDQVARLKDRLKRGAREREHRPELHAEAGT